MVDLVADHLGTIAIESFTPANPDATPQRSVDTRIGSGGTTMSPGARVCFAVAGAPGDVAVVNLTPVLAKGPGNGLLVSSDIADPPVASTSTSVRVRSIRMWRSRRSGLMGGLFRQLGSQRG